MPVAAGVGQEGHAENGAVGGDQWQEDAQCEVQRERHTLDDHLHQLHESGKYLGRLKATGIRPAFSEHLDNFGIKLPPDLFAPEPFAAR